MRGASGLGSLIERCGPTVSGMYRRVREGKNREVRGTALRLRGECGGGREIQTLGGRTGR
jgi:hypothetical protein